MVWQLTDLYLLKLPLNNLNFFLHRNNYSWLASIIIWLIYLTLFLRIIVIQNQIQDIELNGIRTIVEIYRLNIYIVVVTQV